MTLKSADDLNARIYACYDCGKLRSKAEGGTVFTVCDECWDKHFSKRLRKDGESQSKDQA